MISSTLPPWITPTLPPAAAESQLPPHITPTLPPDTVTTPSGLIVPKAPSGSGLIIVRNELTPVSKGATLVVATEPLSGDGALEAAKAAHAELAAASGTPAADIVHGREIELATQVRNDELRAQAVAAFLAGDTALAAELLRQQH